MLGEPFARNDFKAIRRTFLTGCLCRLALFARIDASGQQLARRVAFLSCIS